MPPPEAVERKLAERPKRLLRKRDPPVAEAEPKRPTRQTRQALQVNDSSNRVRRRVAAIEGVKAGAEVELVRRAQNIEALITSGCVG